MDGNRQKLSDCIVRQAPTAQEPTVSHWGQILLGMATDISHIYLHKPTLDPHHNPSRKPYRSSARGLLGFPPERASLCSVIREAMSRIA